MNTCNTFINPHMKKLVNLANTQAYEDAIILQEQMNLDAKETENLLNLVDNLDIKEIPFNYPLEELSQIFSFFQ